MPAAPTYNLKYQIDFSNENNEFCRINLSSLTDNGDVVTLKADQDALSISFPNNEENKFSPIRGSALEARLFIYDADGIDLSTFLGSDDEWKVDYYKGADLTRTYWQGYLDQEEHSREMQDEPWNFELHALDGLGLMKDKAFIKSDGTKFSGLNFLLDYIGDPLWQVNPFLELITHVNIFNIAMDDRDIDPKNDPLLQTKVEARSWLSDAVTFEDCYSVIEKILTAWGCELFQWNGAWHIVDLWDIMKGQTSYTTYIYDLVSPTDAHIRIVHAGAINESFEAKIAPYNNTTYSGPIEPEGEDQIIGLKFANKSVKLTYNYEPWPELPTNNKFERGTLSIPLSGVGYSAYILDNWEFGKATDTGTSASLPWTLTTPTGNAYSKRSFDAFGVETAREIVMTCPHTSVYAGNEANWLRSEGFPVTAGDKISISFQFRLGTAWTSIDAPAVFTAYVVNEAGTAFYGLVEDEFNTPPQHGVWELNVPGAIFGGSTADDYITYSARSCDSQPIPVTGTLYLVFRGFRAAEVGQVCYWSDFQFTYMPFIAGGFRQVKGETRTIAQNTEYKQSSSVEIALNDSIHGVLKGAMYRYTNVGDTYVLTSPVWYRYGVSESRAFAEIQALKRFWHTYRAMQKIEGTFNGLHFFQTTELPFGLIARLWPEWLGDKRYMLTNSEENHKQGTFKATMIEVGSETDAAITIDTNRFDYIFQ